MSTCPKEAPAWQATGPGIVRHLRDALQLASNTSAMCHHPPPKKLTSEAVFMMGVIFVFLALALIGSSITLYEYTRKASAADQISRRFKKKRENGNFRSKEHEKSSAAPFNSVWMKNCKPLLNCFCLQKNGKRLLNVSSKQQHLHCLDGVRAIGMILVIVSHTFGFYINVLRKSEDNLLESFNTTGFLKGILAVDAFFLLSGVLNGYLVSSEYHEKNGKISWLSFPIRRFIKLTPTQLIVVGFYTTLFPYIGSGPVWPHYDTNPVCRTTWIWNLLYLNNFLPHGQQCMTSNWYLACLMQMHVISPFFLIPLIRWPKIGYASILFAVVGSCIVNFVLIMKFDLVSSFIPLFTDDSPDIAAVVNQIWPYFDIVYNKPYSRLISYLVGIALGSYLCTWKLNNTKRNSKVALALGWIISAMLMWFCSCAVISFRGSSYKIVSFHVIKHLFYACSLSWIVFVCVTGQGGFLSNFLSSKFFGVLSNISYEAYLVQMLVLEKYFLSFEELMDHSLQSLIVMAAYLLLWILAVSFLVSLVFGLPVVRMYELLSSKSKKK